MKLLHNPKRLSLSAVLLGGLLVAATPVLADREDLKAFDGARISLVDAIQAAESAGNGKAFEAAIDDDSFEPEYEVSLARDGKVFDVRINAVTGEVKGVREDTDD